MSKMEEKPECVGDLSGQRALAWCWNEFRGLGIMAWIVECFDAKNTPPVTENNLDGTAASSWL